MGGSDVERPKRLGDFEHGLGRREEADRSGVGRAASFADWVIAGWGGSMKRRRGKKEQRREEDEDEPGKGSGSPAKGPLE
jgi:hypothetical protein